MAERAVVKQLQADILKDAITEKSEINMEVVVHDSIDSTNSWSLQQCKSGRSLPFACFAEQQTSGRGRRGKQWQMSANSNVAMSVTWPFALSYQQIHLLPLAIAMAVVETLENLNLQEIQVKWPNDVYVQGKKIAGILIETQAIEESQVAETINVDKYLALVIGVGLNYDMSVLKIDKSLDLPVLTDICAEFESQKIELKPERTIVASILLQHVIAMCQNFQQNTKHTLEKFRAQYDYCKDKNVEIIMPNNDVLSGIALGINDNAELLVLVDGNERAFNSAEVSVKADQKTL